MNAHWKTERVRCRHRRATRFAWWLLSLAVTSIGTAQGPVDDRPPTIPIAREALNDSLERLTGPLEQSASTVSEDVRKALKRATSETAGLPVQHRLDPHVSIVIRLNPEARVRCYPGPAPIALTTTQPTWTLVKIINDCGSRAELRITTRETGEPEPRAIWHWVGNDPSPDAPWPRLSGSEVEYRWLQIACPVPGWREVTVAFDAGAGTQDIGFRGETALLLRITE
jgi:hypothetical protein